MQVSDVCVRVSAYPETASDAAEMCADEGSKLVEIPDETVWEEVTALVEVKRRTITYFAHKNEFWLGAAFNGDIGWHWSDLEGVVLNKWSNGKPCEHDSLKTNYPRFQIL